MERDLSGAASVASVAAGGDQGEEGARGAGLGVAGSASGAGEERDLRDLGGASVAGLAGALAVADAEEKIQILQIVDELDRRQRRNAAQGDFLTFVRAMWPDFIGGAHHSRMADIFNAVVKGEKKRVIINLAPRHTKSKFASYLLPAWFLGRNPNAHIMEISNTAELAEGFGRDVRNLLNTPEYQEIFPEVELRADSKAAGRWNTNQGGAYYAAGIGAAIAGRGANLCMAEGSLVNNGKPTPIEAIEIGDKIATVTGWETITAKKLTIHETCVVINQQVKSSRNHLFLRPRAEWVEAKDLRIGDKLLTRSIWHKLRELSVNGAKHPPNNTHGIT